MFLAVAGFYLHFRILKFLWENFVYAMRTHFRSDKNAADTKDFSALRLEKSKYRRFYTVLMRIYKVFPIKISKCGNPEKDLFFANERIFGII